MTHQEPTPPLLAEAQAGLAALRLALLQAEARLTVLRESETHERAMRRLAEARLAAAKPADAQGGANPDPAMLQAELRQLRLHLAAFEDSAIWRATWPLRRVLTGRPGLARLGRRALRAGWWTLTLQWPARLRERADRRRSGPAARDPGPQPDHRPGHGPGPCFDPRPDDLDPGLALETSDTPLVSIIVPSFGQVAVTLRCLRAIASAQTRTPFEVIVAEDASGDPAVALLERVDGLVLLRNPDNLGFIGNCNQAALSARGRYLLFLNNDTEPLPGFLDALVAAAEAVPDAGLVGAKLLFPDGRLQEAGCIVWQDGTGWNYGRGDDPGLPQYNAVRDTDYVSGAAMLLRRDLFEVLGGFDPLFAPAYYEDTDLAFKVRARGLRVIYQPASVVVHHEGLSHGIDPGSGVKARQEINRHRFVARWPKLLAREHMPPGSAPGSAPGQAPGQPTMRAAAHGRGRPAMLVIDHYVPEPDRDAGSRSTLSILTALRQAGWLVAFWPMNRTRNVYTSLLETMGITVLDDRIGLGFDAWFAAEGSQFDHVMTMRPTVAPWFLSALLTGTTATLSFYGHDVHHLRLRRQAALQGDRHMAQEADAMERRERALWGLFDIVLYPSETEAALVRRLMPGTRAHAIVPYAFDRFPARGAPPRTPSLLFVAGFAHPPNVDAALWLVAEILPRVRRRVPQATLVLAGSHPTETVLGLASEAVTVTGSLDSDALDACYRDARAAIVPLRAGAGVKGKVVEALQQGVPLVTTPIGAEGIDGLERIVDVTDDPDRMAEALSLLLTDDRAWSDRAAAQIAYAARHFSRTAFAASLFAALAPGGTDRGPDLDLA